MRGVFEDIIKFEAFIRAEYDFVIGTEIDTKILIIGDLPGDHGTDPDGDFDSCLLLFLIIALSIHLLV